MIRRVGWRHTAFFDPSLFIANPPTQNPHIQPVGWLLNGLLIPLLLYANLPYYFLLFSRPVFENMVGVVMLRSPRRFAPRDDGNAELKEFIRHTIDSHSK